MSEKFHMTKKGRIIIQVVVSLVLIGLWAGVMYLAYDRVKTYYDGTLEEVRQEAAASYKELSDQIKETNVINDQRVNAVNQELLALNGEILKVQAEIGNLISEINDLQLVIVERENNNTALYDRLDALDIRLKELKESLRVLQVRPNE